MSFVRLKRGGGGGGGGETPRGGAGRRRGGGVGGGGGGGGGGVRGETPSHGSDDCEAPPAESLMLDGAM